MSGLDFLGALQCLIVEHSAPFYPFFALALRSLRRGPCPSRPVSGVLVVPVYRLVERFDVYDCRQFCRQVRSFFVPVALP
jgi:hypothetical protein